MNKVELLNAKFIQARKEKNEIARALFSSFKGEYDNVLKNKSPEGDVTIEKLAKKFTENAKTVNTPDSLIEIELLKPFMPISLSDDRIKEIIVEVASINPDKANNYKLGNKGAFTGMVMKQIAGKADASIVTKIIEEILV